MAVGLTLSGAPAHPETLTDPAFDAHIEAGEDPVEGWPPPTSGIGIYSDGATISFESVDVLRLSF